MYTVTFSNEELEEMKANDAVVIVSCTERLWKPKTHRGILI